MARRIKTEAEIEARFNRISGIPTPPATNTAGRLPAGLPNGEGDEGDEHEDDLRLEGQDDGDGEGDGDDFNGDGSYSGEGGDEGGDGFGHEGDDDEADGDLRAELARLRQQMRSMQNRVAPSQRLAEEHRRRAEDAERNLRQREADLLQQLEDAQRQLAEANAAPPSVDELLTPEERELFDPAQLPVFVKLAGEIARRSAPQIDVRSEVTRTLQEREAQRVNDYRSEVIMDPSRGLTQLATLKDDPRFEAWCNHEDNALFNLTMQSLLTASTTKDIDRLAKSATRQLEKYRESIKSGQRRRPASVENGQDARTARLAHAARRTQSRRLDSTARAELEAEVKRLSRSKNPENRKRAAELLAKLDT